MTMYNLLRANEKIKEYQFNGGKNIESAEGKTCHRKSLRVQKTL